MKKPFHAEGAFPHSTRDSVCSPAPREGQMSTECAADLPDTQPLICHVGMIRDFAGLPRESEQLRENTLEIHILFG